MKRVIEILPWWGWLAVAYVLAALAWRKGKLPASWGKWFSPVAGVIGEPETVAQTSGVRTAYQLDGSEVSIPNDTILGGNIGFDRWP